MSHYNYKDETIIIIIQYIFTMPLTRTACTFLLNIIRVKQYHNTAYVDNQSGALRSKPSIRSSALYSIDGLKNTFATNSSAIIPF